MYNITLLQSSIKTFTLSILEEEEKCHSVCFFPSVFNEFPEGSFFDHFKIQKCLGFLGELSSFPSV